MFKLGEVYKPTREIFGYDFSCDDIVLLSIYPDDILIYKKYVNKRYNGFLFYSINLKLLVILEKLETGLLFKPYENL